MSPLSGIKACRKAVMTVAAAKLKIIAKKIPMNVFAARVFTFADFGSIFRISKTNFCSRFSWTKMYGQHQNAGDCCESFKGKAF
jgi:hypothetical protein